MPGISPLPSGSAASRRRMRPGRRSVPPRPAPRRRCWSGWRFPMAKSAKRRGGKPAPPPETRCGYVALIGAPNSGKSTLLNQLVGRKLAIVTPKGQPPRTRLLGIAIAGTAQLILIDPPGIFEPRRRLDRAMVAAAWTGAADADRTVLLVDAARPQNSD